MKPLILKPAPMALAMQEPTPLTSVDTVFHAPWQNQLGCKSVRTRRTKKQKAFNAAKRKRQLKRKQQQHTRAK